MRIAIPCLAAASLAALFLSRVEGGRLPQVATGGDALSVAFADAKAMIGAAMMKKADSYFHGGIDVECHECGGHEHERDGIDECHKCRDHEHESNCERHCDPWRWINVHVRAPERHVHLDDERAVEMLPWFWAAVRANPHDLDAWTTAAYAAEKMMKDRPLALRVIREAKAKNPDSLEVALAEARIVYDGGKGDVAAAERLLEGARATGKRLCGGRLSSLSVHDAETYCVILEYLSKVIEGRGDAAALRELAEEASATGADTPAAKSVSARVR